MAIEHWLLLAVAVLGVVCFVGFFRTKTPGFGRFTTGVLLILVMAFVSAVLLIGGRIEPGLFGHIVFAVLGFAGGLFVAKD